VKTTYDATKAKAEVTCRKRSVSYDGIGGGRLRPAAGYIRSSGCG
jgi:hypothetical protein